ncbi:hypothetical protein MPSEU_000151800 [Mayamaea pseudoterrestris]|nr:hypothetical protein MPSEU_000151800 [Mayamaea pseudoterrestris]
MMTMGRPTVMPLATCTGPLRLRRTMDPDITEDSLSATSERRSSSDSDTNQQRTPFGYPRSLDDFIAASSSSPSSSASGQLPTNKTTPWRYCLIFLSLGVANSSDASEILCISYVLSLPDFQSQILHSHGAGVLAATVFGGMLLGGLLVGSLGDYRGRRPMLLIGLAINCGAGILSACSPHLYFLCLVRFFAGIGIGATVPPLFTLCSELPSARDRGFWVSVCASFWMVGSIYVAIVGWVVLQVYGYSWRLFVLACSLPSALGWLMVYLFVTESPRFLLLHGRYDRAAAIANYLADCMGSRLDAMTEQELREHDILLENIHTQQSSEHECNKQYLSVRGYVATQPTDQTFGEFIQSTCSDFFESVTQLYTQSSLRRTTMLLQVIWFSLSFGSYGLLTWINTLFVQIHLNNIYRNALLFALANLPGNLFSAILMDRVGRTKLLIGSILLASASLLVFAQAVFMSDTDQATMATEGDEIVIDKSHKRARIIVTAACLFQCFSISAWNSVDVLTGELFPTVVRASGMGVCTASGRIGAMLAQFINGALLRQPVRLLLVAALTLLVGAIAPLLLPADHTGKAVHDRIVVAHYQRSVSGSYQQLATRHPASA